MSLSDVSQTRAFLFNFCCVGEKPKLMICPQSSKKQKNELFLHYKRIQLR